ncbi:hypothetical protein GQ53DRAFT_110768 [Thozetella sp. PMI_491]|nr:hypothetical protein GQ53DRAFT_110768 [Thozetella sp. PMI_491]
MVSPPFVLKNVLAEYLLRRPTLGRRSELNRSTLMHKYSTAVICTLSAVPRPINSDPRSRQIGRWTTHPGPSSGFPHAGTPTPSRCLHYTTRLDGVVPFSDLRLPRARQRGLRHGPRVCGAWPADTA